MSTPVIAVAGAIASGKTTISRHIATSFGWAWTSFGNYVRAEAQRRGLSDDRRTLQRLGDDLIGLGLGPFCRAVLQEAGWMPGQPAVLDGVRHVTVVQALQTLVSPQRLILVVVTIPEDVRTTRLQARGIEPSEQQQHDRHPNEADVLTKLPQMADVVLDGSLDLDIAIASLNSIGIGLERQ